MAVAIRALVGFLAGSGLASTVLFLVEQAVDVPQGVELVVVMASALGGAVLIGRSWPEISRHM